MPAIKSIAFLSPITFLSLGHCVTSFQCQEYWVSTKVFISVTEKRKLRQLIKQASDLANKNKPRARDSIYCTYVKYKYIFSFFFHHSSNKKVLNMKSKSKKFIDLLKTLNWNNNSWNVVGILQVLVC